MQSFALAHQTALLRTHLHPALGVPPEHLPVFRRHRKPSFARTFEFKLVMRLTATWRLGANKATWYDPDQQQNNRRYRL
jgi:hypothetical protein